MFDPVSISNQHRKTADVQSGDQFQRFVRGIGGRALAVEVKVIGVGRSLEIPFLKGFTMPHPVSLIDGHVIHMNGDPDIAGGIGDLIVDVVFDDKVVCFNIAILNIVNTRCSPMKNRISHSDIYNSHPRE